MKNQDFKQIEKQANFDIIELGKLYDQGRQNT